MVAMLARIPGIELPLGGDTYIVPPLSLNAMIQLKPRLDKFGGTTEVDDMVLVRDAAHSAIHRNYPEITVEQVGDLIDVGNMNEVFQAVMDVSGAVRKAQESGEVKPG